MNVDKERLEDLKAVIDRGLIASVEGGDTYSLWLEALTEVERLFTRSAHNGKV